MIISVLGLGYIGLPTAAVFAARKIQVIGVDINAQVVNTINQGKVHLIEPELDMIVHAVVTEGYLQATTTPQAADVFIITVPTPITQDKTPDLSYIQSAAQAIAPVLQKNNLVILESTSPVGTTEQLAQWLAETRHDLTFPHQHGEQADIHIAYCPERVLPGHILDELIKNDRIIGGMTPACAQKAVQLYQHIIEGQCLITDCRTAELCKLTENSFRDVNIAFANELSMICDQLHINVWELIRLANHHPRVNILKPGPGVGGHCIAVDPWFIVHSAPEQAQLIATARTVNDKKPQWVVHHVEQVMVKYLQQHPDKTLKDITITCFGLSFKANIDDLRESPAIHIVKTLAEKHPGHIIVVEPHIQQLPTELATLVELQLMDKAIQETNIVLLLVDHQLFYNFPTDDYPQILWIDVRGIWT